MKINLSHGRTSAHNIHTLAPRETEPAGREENERKGGERDDGRGERMTGRGGAVITRRQLRNDGRGEEEMYEKMEIKEGEAETWRANRDTELEIGRKEELSGDAIIPGEIWENAALQSEW